MQPTAEERIRLERLRRNRRARPRAGGLRVLPFLYGTPSWLSHQVHDAADRQRPQAHAPGSSSSKPPSHRYGPRGRLLGRARARNYEPLPARSRSANGRSGTRPTSSTSPTPASPQRYAKLLKITSPAIKRVEPARGSDPLRACSATRPRARRTRCRPSSSSNSSTGCRGSGRDFDGVALHPYADNAERLEELIEEMRAVVLENRDPSTRLYITEMGWGSQNDPNTVSLRAGGSRPGRRADAGLRIPDRKPQPAQPKGHLLVLLEGPSRRLQLLRLGRLLPRRQAPEAEARLARLRRPHRRPRDALRPHRRR